MRLATGIVGGALAGFADVGAASEGSWSTVRGPMVCFPPAAPISGDSIPNVAAAQRGRAVVRAPAELADYVNETFYPALSSRLLAGTLGNRLERRLEAYRTRRSELINELADQMVALHGADEATRGSELQAFAVLQSPRILAFEQEAEELRRAVVDGRLLQASVDWSRQRGWVIGVARFRSEQAEKEAQFQTVRAAAFYQDGLMPAQRGLLLEVAAELQALARAARPVPGARTTDPTAMYFSPATARLRLPKNLTPDLITKIGGYNREKNALKTELREAVFAHDKDSADERRAAFAALADEQWPRLVGLDALAEEIRVGLAALPPVRLSAPPHIPPGLMRRIDEYQRDRQRFIEEFEQTLQAASSLVPNPRLDPRLPPNARMQVARQLAEERAGLRAKVAAAFQESSRERYQAMRERFDAIQADLRLVAAGQFDRETGRPLTADTLIRGYTEAMARFDIFGREEVIYRGYRIAMLMPGLSPEQRRLLFGAALVGLAQPLPFAEPPPSGPQPVPQS